MLTNNPSTLLTSSKSLRFLSPNLKESQAYSQLKKDIVNHKYPSGTILSERKISEVYDMSRTPVRDALRQLTHEGLLIYVPGIGTIIPEYTIKDILEVYDLMESLQIYAINRCIKNIPIKALDNILLTMHTSLESQNLDDFVKWDKDFHLFIINCCDNQRLKLFYVPLDNQSSQFKATASEDLSQAKRSYSEHADIVKAIQSNAIFDAEKAIKVHYKNIKQYHIDKLIYKN